MTLKGIDLPVPRDILDSVDADVKTGVLEVAVALLNETASLVKAVPYLGVIATVLLEINKIKGVWLLLSSILSETQSCAVYTGGRPLSRILGGGHVQRRQGSRSREALWRSLPTSRTVR